MSAGPPPPPPERIIGDRTGEQRAYRVLTAGAIVALVVGWIFLQHVLIDRAVDKRLREQRQIYTLECQLKGEG